MISFLLSGQAMADEHLRLYHSVRLAHDRGEVGVSARELHQAYQDLPEESFLRPDFFNLTVEQAIRDDDAETILCLLSGHTEDYVQQISQNCFLGVCRVLARSHRSDECRSLLRVYLKSMPRNHRLYFLEPARALFDAAQDDLGDLTQPRGWRAILNEVDQNYDAVDEDDRRTFNRIVTQQLRKIPEGMADYMDIRFDPGAQGSPSAPSRRRHRTETSAFVRQGLRRRGVCLRRAFDPRRSVREI